MEPGPKKENSTEESSHLEEYERIAGKTELGVADFIAYSKNKEDIESFFEKLVIKDIRDLSSKKKMECCRGMDRRNIKVF